jgi:hypothetical protein
MDEPEWVSDVQRGGQADAAVPRFETAPYQPDGGCPPAGVMLMLSTALAAAVALGWLVSLIGQWFYLILLFPIGLGAGVGAAGSWANARAKVRNVVAAGLIGLVAGSAAMVSKHAWDYQRFLHQLDQEQPGWRRQPWAGQVNFLLFLDVRAKQGVRIVGHGGGNGMNLGYIGSYIYWGVEVVIAAALACAILVNSARRPFCAQCSSWKKMRPLGRLRVPPEEAVAVFSGGEIVKLAGQHFGDPAGRLIIQVAECPNCGTDAPVDIILSEVTLNRKGEQQLKERARVTYPGEAIPVLNALAAPPAPAAPAPAPAPPPDADGSPPFDGGARPGLE